MQSLLEVAGEARSALQNGSHSATVLSKTSVGVTVGISTPQVAALLVFQEVSHLTKVRLACLWRPLQERATQWGRDTSSQTAEVLGLWPPAESEPSPPHPLLKMLCF